MIRFSESRGVWNLACSADVPKPEGAHRNPRRSRSNVPQQLGTLGTETRQSCNEARSALKICASKFFFPDYFASMMVSNLVDRASEHSIAEYWRPTTLHFELSLGFPIAQLTCTALSCRTRHVDTKRKASALEAQSLSVLPSLQQQLHSL